MSQSALKLREPVRHEGGAGMTLSPAELARGIGATPMDHYVIWNGQAYEGRAGSRCSQALALISEAWTPVPLRELILRGARVGDCAALRPDRARDAVRAHQRVQGACYLLVRKTALGDYCAVTDVPSPASHPGPLRAGDLILDRRGKRFPA